MISAARGEAVFNIAYFTNERESLWLCDFTQLELTSVLCQQPSVPTNSVCNISHPAFPKEIWACTIFYSCGIVGIGSGGFGRVGAWHKWCRWQLWLLSSARGMPQRACDAAVFCIQGKQLYPAELSGGITHHWCHRSPDAETYFSMFPSRKFEWQTSGDNGKQLDVIDSMAWIRPSVLFSFEMIHLQWAVGMWLKQNCDTCVVTLQTLLNI